MYYYYNERSIQIRLLNQLTVFNYYINVNEQNREKKLNVFSIETISSRGERYLDGRQLVDDRPKIRDRNSSMT